MALKLAEVDVETGKVRSTLGNHLKRLRWEAGLTQDAVAERSGIYRTYLSRIEGGTANPSLVVIHALATTFGTNVHDLFV